MSAPGTWLITGATRGIGLAATEAHLARGGRVIATHRNTEPGAALRALRDRAGTRLQLLAWDLRDRPDPHALAMALDGPIEVLFGNGAVYGPRGAALRDPDYAGMAEAFNVNALGVLRLVEAGLPHMDAAQNPRIVAITSLLGTLPKAGPNDPGYRMSKAALNMVMHVIAAELADRRITTACLRPGHVRTDMGGPRGALSPAESAAALIAVTDGLRYQPAPQLLDLTGDPLPW